MGKGKGCAIGCGVVLVIIFLVLFVGIKLISTKFGPVIGNITGTGGQVAKILKEVGGADAFIPPVDGLINETRFVDFIEIRERTVKKVESFAKFVEQLEKEDAKMSEVLKIFDEISQIFLERALGLKEKNMSLGEYNWYFRQVASILIASEANELPEKMKGILDVNAIENAINQFSNQLDNVQKQSASSGVSVDSFQDGWVKLQRDIGKDRNKLEEYLLSIPEQNLVIIQKYRNSILKTAVLFLFGM